MTAESVSSSAQSLTVVTVSIVSNIHGLIKTIRVILDMYRNGPHQIQVPDKAVDLLGPPPQLWMGSKKEVISSIWQSIMPDT